MSRRIVAPQMSGLSWSLSPAQETTARAPASRTRPCSDGYCEAACKQAACVASMGCKWSYATHIASMPPPRGDLRSLLGEIVEIQMGARRLLPLQPLARLECSVSSSARRIWRILSMTAPDPGAIPGDPRRCTAAKVPLGLPATAP